MENEEPKLKWHTEQRKVLTYRINKGKQLMDTNGNIKLKWSTQKRRVNDLIPYEENPRQMTEKQKEDLQKSLEKFDLVEIPAIDTDDKICAGHQRMKMMQLLGRGEETIDVRVPNRKLTDEEFREYNLRSNKNTAEWDYDLLANIGEELLLDVGFDKDELDNIFNLDEPEDIDEVPELPEKPISKIGDIYQLENHRLMCGDATKREDVEKLMGGEKVDMVFTDPPYGMNLDTDYSQLNSKLKFVQEKHLKQKTGNKYDKVIGDEIDFNPQFLLDLFDYCKEIFLWGGDYYFKRLPEGGSLFVWDKRGGEQFDKMYGSTFEICWSKDKHKREIIRHIWAGVFGTEKEDIRGRVHPTQKPIGVCKWFIEKFSKRGQNITDLFGGSGSTLIACEQLNRKCFMMELDPKYCDVIIQRFEKFTNQKAIKITINQGTK